MNLRHVTHKVLGQPILGQTGVLRHVANDPAQGEWVLAGIEARQATGSSVGRKESQQQLDERALACAVWAKEAGTAPAHLQRHTIQRLDTPKPLA